LDLLATFLLDRHNTLAGRFSKLFSGDFIKQTGVNTSPEYFLPLLTKLTSRSGDLHVGRGLSFCFRTKQ
jgi:hypothetical protein